MESPESGAHRPRSASRLNSPPRPLRPPPLVRILTEKSKPPAPPSPKGYCLVSDATRAVIDDTYAEAFRSIYAEVLITARDRKWLDTAVSAATGNASSSILCDCEAGLDRYLGP